MELLSARNSLISHALLDLPHEIDKVIADLQALETKNDLHILAKLARLPTALQARDAYALEFAEKYKLPRYLIWVAL